MDINGKEVVTPISISLARLADPAQVLFFFFNANFSHQDFWNLKVLLRRQGWQLSVDVSPNTGGGKRQSVQGTKQCQRNELVITECGGYEGKKECSTWGPWGIR